MDEHITVKSDWQTKDMPEENATFVFTRSFSPDQMEILCRGHIPLEMEDKWFWYTEGNKLYAHRSWTGICVFVMEFNEDNDHIVTVNRDPEQYACKSIEEDRNMVGNLIERWSRSSYDYYEEWLSETVDAINKNRFSEQELVKFSIKISGGMNGGSRSTVLSAGDGESALLEFSDTASHHRPPVEIKYSVSKTALSEIKTVFIECGMYGWEGKKFSDQFVKDGASKRYTFIFSDDDISFSSQIYGEEDALKLDKLDAIIEKYHRDGSLIE